jgi:hypothetical protein
MRISEHAMFEARKEGLQATDVFHAVFNGHILERYYERGRVLIAGPSAKFDIKIHVVCDYADDSLVVVTVYVPDRPKWVNDVVRGQLPPV